MNGILGNPYIVSWIAQWDEIAYSVLSRVSPIFARTFLIGDSPADTDSKFLAPGKGKGKEFGKGYRDELLMGFVFYDKKRVSDSDEHSWHLRAIPGIREHRFHNTGGPAFLSDEAEYWYERGLPHRKDGPAFTCRFRGAVVYMAWYENGVCLRRMIIVN